jgi:5-(carboxyamino)imidazole ribonucleotide mutase
VRILCAGSDEYAAALRGRMATFQADLEQLVLGKDAALRAVRADNV